MSVRLVRGIYRLAPIVVGGGGAPEPDVGSTILFQDDMEQANLTAQLAPLDDNGPAGFARITPGRTSGTCLQIQYAVATPGPTFGAFIPETRDLYVRWYFRVTPGWVPYSGVTNSGFKWFLTKRGDGIPRYTHGVTLLTGGPPGFENAGYEFSTHDQSSTLQTDPTQQNIRKDIRFNTCNDGNWHKATYHVVTDIGGGKGYEQIWIDDQRVLDTSPGQPGVPAGGYDHLNTGITQFQFGDLVVDGIPDSSWAGNIDYDDVVAWHN